ncbi:MAG: hypothetical protein AAGA31_14010 [Bacteroidota bacterium]
MKNLLIFFLLFSTFSAPAASALMDLEQVLEDNGGSEKYRALMQELIQLVDTAKTEASIMRAANTFERIAVAETDEWLPGYYAAYCYLNLAMATKDLDRVDPYRDKALHLINSVGEIEGADESELLCLASLAATSGLRVDMFARGLEYSAQAESLLRAAGEANPENPRVAYLQARLIIGRPKQFGGGLQAGLPTLRLAAQKFAENPHPSASLLPDWGRKRTVEILEAVAAEG